MPHAISVLRPDQRQPGVAVIDVGQYKTACVIARLLDDGYIEILGAARRPSRGITGGVVTQLPAVRDVMLSALGEAERAAGLRAHRVCVAMSGGHQTTQHVSATTPLPRGVVASADLERVNTRARDTFVQPDRCVLHAAPVQWRLDTMVRSDMPAQAQGRTLGVDMAIISAGAGSVRNLTNTVDRTGLDLRAVVAAGYGAGLAAATDEERQLGVTVIDLGAGVTSAATFKHGRLVHFASIPVGGGHVTNDLAHALSCSLAEAERIKRHAGDMSAQAASDGSPVPVSSITGEGEPRFTSIATVSQVMRARYEEILELVHARLITALGDECIGETIVLTGGGAWVKGVTTLANAMTGQIVSGVARRGPATHVVGFCGQETRLDLTAAIGACRMVLQGVGGVMPAHALVRSAWSTGPREPMVERALNWFRRAV